MAPARARSGRARWGVVACTALALVVPIGGMYAASGATDPEPTSSTADQPVDWTEVTLITGDTVRLAPVSDGKHVVRIEPRPDRQDVTFYQRAEGDRLSVVPSDAASLITAGRLDPRLFDVSELAADGYDDASRTNLPLILAGTTVTGTTGTGTTATRELPAISGSAIVQQKADAAESWPDLRDQLANSADTDDAHVWLDGTLRANLDKSVPQIGAPEAWAAGQTGKGVTVGILDTGIDATHPDLDDAVVRAKDFTGSQSGTKDRVGHGTHVASTVTGGSSTVDQRFKGVAPDAKLLVGKVLNDSGMGTYSELIAGMEWAADQGADVVNMSLGADIDSDGGDPVSTALDAISERTGTLFVVAAGNSNFDLTGWRDQTVGIPAVADNALAVGAVGRNDGLAEFSSTGPRAGDAAIKPELTAPGVGIAAARARGTQLGMPVGERYVRATGTSMATPHVAGAAALLAQQHPNWSADQLKRALMNTAAPHRDSVHDTVYERGAGRVDIARGVRQDVWADPGSVSFQLEDGRSDPVVRTIEFRNDGGSAVTLDVELTMTRPNGRPVPAEMFTSSTDRLRVPADGTAELTVTARPGDSELGRYSGELTAVSGDTEIGVPVGAVRERETHTVTIDAIDRTGRPATGSIERLPYASLVKLDTGRVFPVYFSDGEIAARVPTGRYSLDGYVDTYTDDGALANSTLISEPALEVDDDTTVTVDARNANRVTATVDSDTAVRKGMTSAGVIQKVGDLTAMSGIGTEDADVELYAMSTSKVTSRLYDFYYTALLVEPLGSGTSGTAPKAYNLAELSADRVPERPHFRPQDSDLGVLDSRYHLDGNALRGVRFSAPVLPGDWMPAGGGEYGVRVPGRRTELYSTEPGTTWWRYLTTFEGGEFVFDENSGMAGLTPGHRGFDDWNVAGIGPRAEDGIRSKCKEGGVLMVAYVLNPSNARWQMPDPDQVGVTWSRNGEQLASENEPAICVPTPAGRASYTFEATAERDVSWTGLGTRADVTWKTDYTPDLSDPLDSPNLINLRATGGFDLRNRAPAGQTFELELHAEWSGRLDQDPPTTPVRTPEAEVSFDDGESWQRVRVESDGDNHWTARVPHPEKSQTNGYVGLRLHADDGNGNAVDQTVLRAYALR